MKKCKYCGKKMKDSELFCPRCAREYREDFFGEKLQVDSVFSEEDEHLEGKFKAIELSKKPFSKEGTSENKGKQQGPFILLAFLAIIMIASFPPLAPLLIFVLFAIISKKNKGRK